MRGKPSCQAKLFRAGLVACPVKMPFNPCLCIPLDIGTKIVAVIDACLTIYVMVDDLQYNLALLEGDPFSIDSINYNENNDATTPTPSYIDTGDNALKGIIILVIIIAVFQFLFAVGLFFGVQVKLAGICWAWILGTLVSFTIHIFLYLKGVKETESYPDKAILIIAVVLRIYTVVVVLAFILHVRQQRPQERVSNERDSAVAGPVETESQINYTNPRNLDNPTWKNYKQNQVQPSSSSVSMVSQRSQRSAH